MLVAGISLSIGIDRHRHAATGRLIRDACEPMK